uniref:DUF1995 domain-containing protein n=1 Tax=Zooxanthella nutricula TaxID=1333877 RepID=A0A7S2QIC1_9DINO
MEQLYLKGAAALLQATEPTVNDFVRNLWGGDSLKTVRTSAIDEDSGTLFYREAENAMQDVAVFYMTGRDLVVSGKSNAFFQNMQDRLVIIANPQNAAAPWAPDQRGSEFRSSQEDGRRVADTFAEQTYYYNRGPFRQWQMTTYRAYPFQWKTYIEDLSYNQVLLGETDTMPSSDLLEEWVEAYEAENKITPLRKVGKMLKDTARQEEISEQLEPGWRAGASAQELADRAKKR